MGRNRKKVERKLRQHHVEIQGQGQPSSSTNNNQAYSSQLEMLQVMFIEQLEGSTIEEVYNFQNRDFDRALETLLALTKATSDGFDYQSEEENGKSKTSLWETLPSTCQETILNRLTPKDIARLSLVCKAFNEVSQKQKESRRRVSILPEYSIQNIFGLVSGFPNAGEVDLSPLSFWSDEMDSGEWVGMLQAIATGGLSQKRKTPVVYLNFKGCKWFDIQCLVDVCEVFQHLKRLRLDFCDMLDDSALEYLAQYQQQQWDDGRLFQSGGQYVYGDSGWEGESDVGAMYASDYSGYQRQRGVSPIDGDVMLELRNFHGLSDSVLEEAYEAESQLHNAAGGGLESVSVLGCTRISNTGLRAFLQSSQIQDSLQHFTMSRLNNLTDGNFTALATTRIQKLQAAWCSRLTQISIHLPTKHPLKEAVFPKCNALQSVQITAFKLEVLNLSGCSQLEQLQLKCPELIELNVSNCKVLETISSTSMEENCILPFLRYLNTAGCTALPDEIINPILQQSKFLNQLNISGCFQIFSLNLKHCQHLLKLNAMGCRNLSSVETNSNILREIILSGDKILQRVICLNCQNLSLLDLTNCSQVSEVIVEYNKEQKVGLRSKLHGCFNLNVKDQLKALRYVQSESCDGLREQLEQSKI